MEENKIDKESKKEEKIKIVLEYKIPKKTELVPIEEALKRIKTAGKENTEGVFMINDVFVKDRQGIRFMKEKAIALLKEDGEWKLFIFESGFQLVKVAENISEAIIEQIKNESVEEWDKFLSRLAPMKDAKQVETTGEEEKEEESYFNSSPEGMFQ